ncbi:hypothetical protein HDU76_005885, partial [Blyttiomyces sp. JEL0837]
MSPSFIALLLIVVWCFSWSPATLAVPTGVKFSQISRRDATSWTPNPNQPTNNIPVQLQSYSFDGTTGSFSASIWVQNLAFDKVIQIFYQDFNGVWATTNFVNAGYSSSTSSGGYEIWNVNAQNVANIGSGSQFYVKATMKGNSYYDNNSSSNYNIFVPIQLKQFSCSNGRANGQILVQNIASNKTIFAIFSTPSGSWTNSSNPAATYSGSKANNGYELWNFNGAVADVGSQFFLQYTVNGQTYYDSNGGPQYNYRVISCPSDIVSTTTTTATRPTSTTTTTSTPTPTCLGMKSHTFTSGNRYLAVEAWSDTIFHFEVSELRKKPKNDIYMSPMIDTKTLKSESCLTSYKLSRSNSTMDTPRLTVTVDPTTLSVSVFDKLINAVLTKFTYAQLSNGKINDNTNKSTTQLQLQWTREATKAVYGLAQSPGYDSLDNSSEGNYLGKKIVPPKGFGAAMVDVANSGGSMAYTQFPVVYSVAPNGYNYAFFLDLTETLEWDLSDSVVHKVTATGGRALRWFVVAGNSLLDVRKQYMTIVGRPTLVPKHALGYNQGKYGYRNWKDTFYELDGLKAAHIPVDNVIFDLYWFGQVLYTGPNSRFGSLAWDNKSFSNPKATTDYIRKIYGAGVTVIEEPYLARNGPTAKMMLANNALVMEGSQPWTVDPDWNWWGEGYLLDHTNPTGAYLWAECKRCRLIRGCVPDKVCDQYGLEANEGIDEMLGHWQDLAEPEHFDPTATYHGLVEDDGVAMTTSHSNINIFQFMISKATYENYRNHSLPRRTLTLSRTGAPGIQRFGGSLWSADIGSSALSIRLHVGTKKHLTMAGIDYHSSDTGGFHHSGCENQCLHDLYTMWLANSAWFDLPIKPHTDAQETQFSATASAALIGDLNSNVFNVRTRYQLIPLYYSLAYKASTAGDPIFTPLFMAYQEKQLYNFGNQYLIGPIMAPFTSDNPFNANEPQGRGIWLPANTDWYHLHTFDHYTGNDTFTNSISYRVLDPKNNTVITMPALVQAGSIFPMAWADDQTKNHRCWDRFDSSVVCPNLVRVVPGPYSKFTIYEDDGETVAHESGEFVTIVVDQVLKGQT